MASLWRNSAFRCCKRHLNAHRLQSSVSDSLPLCRPLSSSSSSQASTSQVKPEDCARDPRKNPCRPTSRRRNLQLPPEIAARLDEFDDDVAANPFYHVFSSPIRLCAVTRLRLPRELLVELKLSFLPPSKATADDLGRGMNAGPRIHSKSKLIEVYLPNGILHPAYTQDKAGPTAYIGLNKRVLRRLDSLSSPKSGLPFGFAQLGLPSLAGLPEAAESIITRMLQVRVIQEAELLKLSLLKRSRKGKGTSDSGQISSERPTVTVSSSSAPPIRSTPIIILHFGLSASDSPPPPQERRQTSLPLRFHLPTLFTDTQQIQAIQSHLSAIRSIRADNSSGASEDRRTPRGEVSSSGDTISLSYAAAFRNLAVALWRLNRWHWSGERMPWEDEGPGGDAEGPLIQYDQLSKAELARLTNGASGKVKTKAETKSARKTSASQAGDDSK